MISFDFTGSRREFRDYLRADAVYRVRLNEDHRAMPGLPPPWRNTAGTSTLCLASFSRSAAYALQNLP